MPPQASVGPATQSTHPRRASATPAAAWQQAFSTPEAANARAGRRGRLHPRWWWIGTGSWIALGATSGISGVLTFAGLAGAAVTVVALVRGHVDWARLRTRRVAGAGLVGSVVVCGVGASMAAPPVVTRPAAVVSSEATSRSAPASAAAYVPEATSASAAASVMPAPSKSQDALSRMAASADASSALAALVALPVRTGPAPRGYVRSAFGQAWADVDRNGCDTRNDALRRDLTGLVIKPGTNGCTVTSGSLEDPYGGHTVSYVRGGSTVEVDHVVSLADAWASGANRWDLSARTAFANDPLELLATTTALNQAKGDKNAARWLPPAVSFRCQYASLQVAIKSKYTLTVTAAERAAIGKVLTGCTTQGLLEARPVPLLSVDANAAAPTSQPSTSTGTGTATGAGGGSGPGPGSTNTTQQAAVYYANCAAARAAGAAPIHRGEPGYRPGLDRDGDGIACE